MRMGVRMAQGSELLVPQQLNLTWEVHICETVYCSDFEALPSIELASGHVNVLRLDFHLSTASLGGPHLRGPAQVRANSASTKFRLDTDVPQDSEVLATFQDIDVGRVEGDNRSAHP